MQEKVSAGKERPALQRLLPQLRPGDFTLPDRIAAGELRPLRDSANWEERLAEFP